MRQPCSVFAIIQPHLPRPSSSSLPFYCALHQVYHDSFLFFIPCRTSCFRIAMSFFNITNKFIQHLSRNDIRMPRVCCRPELDWLATSAPTGPTKHDIIIIIEDVMVIIGNDGRTTTNKLKKTMPVKSINSGEYTRCTLKIYTIDNPVCMVSHTKRRCEKW